MRSILILLVCTVLFTACDDNFVGASPEPRTNGRIYYNADDLSGFPTQIFSVDPEGADFRPVSETNCTLFSAPQKGRIAYYRTASSPMMMDAIVVVDTMGQEVFIEEVNGSGTSVIGPPILAPDGAAVAYLMADVSRVLTLEIASTTGARTSISLSDFPAFVYSAERITFSPDGRRIALIIESDIDRRIHVFETSGAHVGTIGTRVGHALTWAPDGERIAYVEQEGDSVEITVNGSTFTIAGFSSLRTASVTGGSTRTITESALEIYDAAWSPNGGTIAYCLWQFSPFLSPASDLWLMRSDGTGQKMLKSGQMAGMLSRYESPQWSPDGKQLLVGQRIDDFFGISYSQLMRIDLQTSVTYTVATNASNGFWEQ